MALPVPEKTWQFNVNNVDAPAGTVLENYAKAMFRVKQILTGFATNPWTVVASSNGVVANSSDNWASFADVVFTTAIGSAHSWIVLKQTGIASNFQLLIACATNTSVGQTAFVRASPAAGFTGLTSTTANPSATDEYAIKASTQYWFDVFSVPFQSVVHGQMSSDGEKTRLVLCAAGNSKAVWVIDKLSNPVTGMTNPVYATIVSAEAVGGTSAATYTKLFSTANGQGRDVSTAMTFYMTTEAFAGAAVGATFISNPNQISNEYPLTAVGVASTTTGKTGRHGRLSDLWFGSGAATITDGSTYPSGAARTFIQCGHLVLPWNGVIPQFT
jgi:hypothetical protein